MGRGKITDLSEQRFGQLQVLARTENSKQGAARWLVRCACGVEKAVRSSVLTNGEALSCGCLKKELCRASAITHGRTGTFEYRVWMAMKKRCTYEKHPRYARYGGRGITICERWMKFENFYVDMGPCPFPDGSIERVDNDGNYTPENCIWLPKGMQSKNRNVCRKQHA